MAEDLANRVKKMLGKGLAPSIVASAVGCDPSYVSQLMEHEDFREDVLVMRAERAEIGLKRDEKWDVVEDMALDKAITMLPLVSRPGDLIRIAGMANNAKRRAVELTGGEHTSPTVTMVFPESAVIHFQMNTEAQVIDIDGRSMVALPTNQLVKQLEERRRERIEAGNVQVLVPRVKQTERKKVESVLESIGYADEPEPVRNVLTNSENKES